MFFFFFFFTCFKQFDLGAIHKRTVGVDRSSAAIYAVSQEADVAGDGERDRNVVAALSVHSIRRAAERREWCVRLYHRRSQRARRSVRRPLLSGRGTQRLSERTSTRRLAHQQDDESPLGRSSRALEQVSASLLAGTLARNSHRNDRQIALAR